MTEVRGAWSEVPDASPPSVARTGEEEVAGGRTPHSTGSDVGRLWRALEEVMDPEIPISLVDLGLIYDIRESHGTVEVDLTFTATACPCMAFIKHDIEERLMREEGVQGVRTLEVWNPPWTKSRITARGRERLKDMGVSM